MLFFVVFLVKLHALISDISKYLQYIFLFFSINLQYLSVILAHLSFSVINGFILKQFPIYFGYVLVTLGSLGAHFRFVLTMCKTFGHLLAKSGLNLVLFC